MYKVLDRYVLERSKPRHMDGLNKDCPLIHVNKQNYV